ncbi:S-methyl-5-thioribose-1-phosphate isomerase [Pelagibacteraceae bacterium]|nr:S-methyl-5-thioribose-1-phosphate isomerase [Pelagibacteraceae bacterium]
MKVDKKKYSSIWVDEHNKVKIIDQTLLPFEFKIIEMKSLSDVLDAITNMRIRGAPLIGVTAAFGIYLSILESSEDENIKKARNKLISTRPTAINLKWAVDKILERILSLPKNSRKDEALSIAKKMHIDDQKINEAIGVNGAKIIENIYKKTKKTVNILTHCNAGWLATVDWGTATAPIYKARDNGIPVHVWVDETRPRNQGSYLTSWELNNEKINNTIIVDNAGGYLMTQNLVDLVITGSDRTTCTGNVCNKIGTYLKALAAYDNKIPFYVALPSSTIDWKISDGKEIIIEERNESEVHFINGIGKNKLKEKVRVTPFGSKAANYAFDITPSNYITGLITEFGLIAPNKQSIQTIKKQQL